MNMGIPSVVRALARRLHEEADRSTDRAAGLTIESDDGVRMEYTRHFPSGMTPQSFVLDRERGTVEEL